MRSSKTVILSLAVVALASCSNQTTSPDTSATTAVVSVTAEDAVQAQELEEQLSQVAPAQPSVGRLAPDYARTEPSNGVISYSRDAGNVRLTFLVGGNP